MTRATDARGAQPRTRHRPRLLRLSVAILFALFFSYDLIEAITNLVGLPADIGAANQFARENGLRPLSVPWGILIANVVLPGAAFVTAWWLGRRQSIRFQVLLYLVALSLVAALTLTMTALV